MLLVTALAICAAAAAVSGEQWWDPVTTFSVSRGEYSQRMLLVSNATRLSYVSTHGSYYNPAEANSTLDEPGWDRAMEENPEYGFHAIAFANAARQRVLVVIRGTDLDVSGVSGQADVCADHFLWNAAPNFSNFTGAPAFCKHFNVSTLDYIARARDFLAAVAQAFPEHDRMVTGHSLGAGIAAMLAAWPRSSGCLVPAVDGALVFAAPDFVFALRQRLLTNFSREAPSIAVVADAYDPVFNSAFYRPFQGMMGTRGLWTVNQTGSASWECDICDAVDHAARLSSPTCFVCMTQRHVFSHYEELVKSVGPPAEVKTVELCSTSPAECPRPLCEHHCC